MLFRNMFRNREDAARLVDQIKSISLESVKIMEVCGTHTMAIAEAGIKDLLPPGVKLVSGPGCPVCVTPSGRIDDVCMLSREKNMIIATYGDMLRVPGTKRNISLEMSRMEGADIRVVYSPMDALNIAINNPQKQVIFLGVGFETTSPTAAVTVMEAFRENVSNFSILSMHKTIEPAMRALLDSGEVKVDAFLLPGHVAVILGTDGFRFIEEEYKIPGVISGFEPMDILKSILMILRQIESGSGRVENEYTRLVSKRGNSTAKQAVEEVFENCDDFWRGLGLIKSSGLKFREKYRRFDAESRIGMERHSGSGEASSCRCGDVIKGIIEPLECPLFGGSCIPDSPVGPCMVSSEGSCAAAYKYR